MLMFVITTNSAAIVSQTYLGLEGGNRYQRSFLTLSSDQGDNSMDQIAGWASMSSEAGMLVRGWLAGLMFCGAIIDEYRR